MHDQLTWSTISSTKLIGAYTWNIQLVLLSSFNECPMNLLHNLTDSLTVWHNLSFTRSIIDLWNKWQYFVSHDKSQPQTGFVLLGLFSMAHTRLEPVTFLLRVNDSIHSATKLKFYHRNSYEKHKAVILAVKLLE